MPSEKQVHFHMCQKCDKMVNKVYQMGYCKKCITDHFKIYREILNEAHAFRPHLKSANSDPIQGLIFEKRPEHNLDEKSIY
ncbi:MAG: hypothetical protein OEZ13_09140 [Spirochaetia bacterium]|nr:hypothetical protein [Spirochaetia bacterium]